MSGPDHLDFLYKDATKSGRVLNGVPPRRETSRKWLRRVTIVTNTA
jgi:hypothetical protein